MGEATVGKGLSKIAVATAQVERPSASDSGSRLNFPELPGSFLEAPSRLGCVLSVATGLLSLTLEVVLLVLGGILFTGPCSICLTHEPSPCAIQRTRDAEGRILRDPGLP